MSNHLENHLLKMLEKLEKAQVFIQKTQSYSKDERRIRMLAEVIKEQLGNENSCTTASQIR